MCGVYLRIAQNKESWIVNFDNQNLKQIENRGPNGLTSKINSSGQILYGFTRLAIRSLENGSQPFIENRFTSVFNGEIYNTKELSEKIKLHFPDEVIPESDTKLLGLWLFLFGPQSITQVIGMFAGYIHIGSKIYAFRDRVGEKPLYFGFYKDLFFISSNLLTFINNDSVVSDFTLITGLLTSKITNEVSILEPSSFLEIDENTILFNKEVKVIKYWEWPRRSLFLNKTKSNDFELVLTSAIKSQLVSDVGMSVLLSGGIDSGIVAAIARQEFGPTLESFTLSFKDSVYSESLSARNTAKHLNLIHQTIEVSFEDLANNVGATLDAMDIPIFDSGALSLFSLCKEVSKSNKVSLTGDGGDELFRGYSVFDSVFIINLLSNLPAKIPILILLNLLNRYFSNSDNYIGPELKLSRALSITSNRENNPLYGAIGPLGGTDLYSLISKRYQLEAQQKKQKFISKRDVESFFTNEILPKIYLVKSDRMSMYHGLELRSPMLDFRVIESAFAFSEIDFLFKPKKDNLKKIALKYLSSEILIAKKHGFSTPFHKVVRYLDTPDWKSPKSDEELDKFNKIWFDARNGKESAGFPAWNLLVREHFFNRSLKK